MPLINNAAIHGEQLIKAYHLGFSLHESSFPMVTSAAVAIVRQLVIWLFDQVAQEDNQSETRETILFSHDALIIFTDICCLLNDEKPETLRLKSIDKSFALELIESVLSNHSRVFREVKHPQIFLY